MTFTLRMWYFTMSAIALTVMASYTRIITKKLTVRNAYGSGRDLI